MKKAILFICLLSIFLSVASFCSPSRPMTSKLVEDKSQFIFLKGYFLQDDDLTTRLAKFKVSQTNDNSYVVGQVYPVFSYGPFGSLCEMYEMGESPLNNKLCGEHNIRYLIAYRDKGDCRRIVTPIFHGHGLVLDVVKDKVSDEHFEYTSLEAFEKYIWKREKDVPEWTKISR